MKSVTSSIGLTAGSPVTASDVLILFSGRLIWVIPAWTCQHRNQFSFDDAHSHDVVQSVCCLYFSTVECIFFNIKFMWTLERSLKHSSTTIQHFIGARTLLLLGIGYLCVRVKCQSLAGASLCHSLWTILDCVLHKNGFCWDNLKYTKTI